MVEKEKRITVRSPTYSKSAYVLCLCWNWELLLMQLSLSGLLAAFDSQYWGRMDNVDCVNKSQFVSLYLDHSS